MTGTELQTPYGRWQSYHKAGLLLSNNSANLLEKRPARLEKVSPSSYVLQMPQLGLIHGQYQYQRWQLCDNSPSIWIFPKSTSSPTRVSVRSLKSFQISSFSPGQLFWARQTNKNGEPNSLREILENIQFLCYFHLCDSLIFIIYYSFQSALNVIINH